MSSADASSSNPKHCRHGRIFVECLECQPTSKHPELYPQQPEGVTTVAEYIDRPSNPVSVANLLSRDNVELRRLLNEREAEIERLRAERQALARDLDISTREASRLRADLAEVQRRRNLELYFREDCGPPLPKLLKERDDWRTSPIAAAPGGPEPELREVMVRYIRFMLSPIVADEIERLRAALEWIGAASCRVCSWKARAALGHHTHSDACWEPDSGCDIGRNEQHVRRSDETPVGMPLPDTCCCPFISPVTSMLVHPLCPVHGASSKTTGEPT
jgi:hypothetical protein